MNKRVLAISFSSVALVAGACFAQCCDCGGCRKVCKLVCTTKTVEATCYGFECEDVCLPKPSTKQCEKRQSVGKCHLLCRIHWTKWCPGGARLVQRKKLTKYVVRRDVPSYKWEVVPACQCGTDAPSESVKPAPAEARLGDAYPLTSEELARFVPAATSQRAGLQR